jgi:hypothetical protein
MEGGVSVKKNVRIIPKRKAIDVERLAEALFALASSLDDPSVSPKIDIDARKLKTEMKGGRPTRKGSAA